MVPKNPPPWASCGRTAIGVAALLVSPALGAGCTALLGVDGDYQAGQGGGDGQGTGGAPSTSTSPPSVDASSASSTNGGGGAGGGGGGDAPFTGLEPCGEALAIDAPMGGTAGYVLAPANARAPRAQVVDGRLSVAWVQGSQPGAAFGFLETDGSIRASSNDCSSAVPFDDGHYRLAAVSTAGDLVASPREADDIVSNASELLLLRDARPTSFGGTFLVQYGDAWAVHEATLDAATFQVVATIPVECSTAAAVADATFVGVDGALVAKVCVDGTIEHPLGIGHANGPRAVAATQHEDTIYTVYRDASGIRLVRGVQAVGEPTITVLSEDPPYQSAPELDAVSVAAVPGGALVAWSRDDTPGVTSLAAAFCPPSGACCAIGLEEAIEAEVMQAGELAANQRVAPSLASMADGSDLALAYAHEPTDGGAVEIVAMRLVISGL